MNALLPLTAHALDLGEFWETVFVALGAAAATTLLAFVVFIPGAWLVDRLMRSHVGAKQ